jgi:hypothetical protein
MLPMTERTAKTPNVSTPILAGVCEANSKLPMAVLSKSGNYTPSLANRSGGVTDTIFALFVILHP